MPTSPLSWSVRGSNPGGGEIFSTRSDRPWGPPSLLYNGYRVIPGGKAAGAWRWPPTPQLAPRLKKDHSYTSTPTSGPSWPVLGWTYLCLPSSWGLCSGIWRRLTEWLVPGVSRQKSGFVFKGRMSSTDSSLDIRPLEMSSTLVSKRRASVTQWRSSISHKNEDLNSTSAKA